jgi:hypothetical protein
MIAVILQGLIETSVLHLFHYFSVFILGFLTLQIAKKASEGTLFSTTTTGFTAYMICFSIYIYFVELPLIYDIPMGETQFYYFHFIFMAIYFIGIIVFVFFTELDTHLRGTVASKKPFPFLLTLITLAGTIVYLILGILAVYDLFITLSIILVPYIIATQEIMKNFENLEIVKREQLSRWFYFGLALSGMSNGLIGLYFAIGSTALYMKYVAIIIGSFLMVYAWKSLPNLSELNWMQKMEQLYLIHNESSTLLYQYQFKTDAVSTEEEVDGDLAGSAIGGIDMLLSEILADSGHIKAIDHGDKKIYFVHGTYATSILIANSPSKEFQYRLEMFHLTFEKNYSEELDEFSGALAPFKDLDDLVRESFLN